MGIMMVNGRFIPEEEVTVSVFDHGLLYGVGAFETIRLYEGHPFLLYDHIERLNEGLKRMSISPPFSFAEWKELIGELARQNGFAHASVRLMVTGGAEGLGLHVSRYECPNSFAWIRPLPFSSDEPFRQGKTLQVVSVPRQGCGGVQLFKTNNYLNSVLARQEVEGFPKTEGLMLTPDGYVAEGIVSNIFFVKNDVLHTPALSLGILDGVTRRFVIRLASVLGIPVKEGKYPRSILKEANEIFMTNSVQEIVPIVGYSGKRWREFPVATRLYEAYQSYVTTLDSVDELAGGNSDDDKPSDPGRAVPTLLPK